MNRLLVLVLVLLAGGAAAQQQQQQQPSTPYYPAPPPAQAPTVQQGQPTTGLSSPLPAGIPKIDRTEIASDAEAQLFAYFQNQFGITITPDGHSVPLSGEQRPGMMVEVDIAIRDR